jgi:hypothetical protein
MDLIQLKRTIKAYHIPLFILEAVFCCESGSVSGSGLDPNPGEQKRPTKIEKN